MTSKKLKQLVACIEDKALRDMLIYLDEAEEKHERWENEKKRRHEVSLDSGYRATFVIEYQLANRCFNYRGIRKSDLEDAIALLDKKEQQLLFDLYYLGMTERQVATKHKVYQYTIHYKKKKILRKLRSILEEFIF